MMQSDDRSVSQQRFCEIIEQTIPENPQTVGRFEVEPSSRPLSNVDKEYGADDEDKSEKEAPRVYSGQIIMEEIMDEVIGERLESLLEHISITSVEPVLQNPNQDSESSQSSCVIQSKKRRSIYVEERRRKKRKIVRGLEVEPVLKNPNLDSESSPSSCVRGRSKEKRPIDVEERSPKKSKVVRCLEVEPIQTTPPDWLLNVMRREENGYNPKLISMKKLYETDLDKRQARLSVPFKQVKNPDFLTEEETRDIDEKALKLREDGVSVDLVDPEQNKHALDLRKRKMSGNWIYVLVKGWKDVVSANRFKVNDVFPLWSFRSGKGKLCFALVPSDATNSSHGGASTSGESGRGNSLSSGASTSGESGQVPLPVPPSPPARDSSHSSQGCSGESSSRSS